MIHHSHGPLSLGPDTAVTHTHMHVNMQSSARGQMHAFISGGVSQALIYLEIAALEMIHKNLQQCRRLLFNKYNDAVLIGNVISFDFACKKKKSKISLKCIKNVLTINTCFCILFLPISQHLGVLVSRLQSYYLPET